MKVWRFLQRTPDARAAPQVPDFIVAQAENLVRIINESAQLAAKSPVLETRQSRLGVAMDRLGELKALVATYPRITLTQLEQLERGLMEVRDEIDLEALLHPLQRGGLADEERMHTLSAELTRPEWADIVSQPGHYAEGIVSYFFPRFLATIPGLPYYTIDAMWDVALHTPNRVAEASDKQLLAFKGIGPAMLRKIRTLCAEISTDRDQPLLDLVNK